MFDNLGDQLYSAIIRDDRWQLYLSGLGNTFIITGLALLIGTIIGMLVAIAKVNLKNKKKMQWAVALLNVYTTVFRGTPMVVQLLIMYFIVFATSPSEFSVYIAALTFGINSGAYVSEIVRGGINSVPIGQAQAGRSLGLSRRVTMSKIVLPQAIKNILPALGNEFITLFKETSIVGYIAIMDLTRAADLIRSRTFQPFVPLIFIALIYLGFVLLMTFILKKVEDRMSKSDNR